MRLTVRNTALVAAVLGVAVRADFIVDLVRDPLLLTAFAWYSAPYVLCGFLVSCLWLKVWWSLYGLQVPLLVPARLRRWARVLAVVAALLALVPAFYWFTGVYQALATIDWHAEPAIAASLARWWSYPLDSSLLWGLVRVLADVALVLFLVALSRASTEEGDWDQEKLRRVRSSAQITTLLGAAIAICGVFLQIGSAVTIARLSAETNHIGTMSLGVLFLLRNLLAALPQWAAVLTSWIVFQSAAEMLDAPPPSQPGSVEDGAAIS